MYEIDSEAVATIEASDVPAPVQSTSQAPTTPAIAASAPVPSPASSPAPSQQHGVRTPSIHFLGKEGWAKVLSGAEGSGASAPTVVYNIPANYGRLPFSEDEMEALIMGGANIAPQIKSYSSGATFAV